MKKYTRLASVLVITLIAGSIVVVHSCKKNCDAGGTMSDAQMQELKAAKPMQQNAPQSVIVRVLEIESNSTGAADVIFTGLEQVFTVTDPVIIASLKNAHAEKKPVSVTYDPWAATIRSVRPASDNESRTYNTRPVVYDRGSVRSVNLDAADADAMNNSEALGVLNNTSTGLTNVVPDWATAQLMFDFIAHQCCVLSGPYGIDHCIPFQYCIDGCFARAHKMCWIINKKYNYETHKIFSFAYPSGSYRLGVQGQKWGGCCINWWYHVAPLVSIKTPTGVKAYVFDPAMFDQPVLLATWLHAQKNPACPAGSKTITVTSYNIQPTTSYQPNDTSSFDTDPTYYYTNMTLVNYAHLKTCP